MTNGKLAVFAGLAAMLALGSGCIITTSDNTVDSGVFRATWSVNGSMLPTACTAVGADKTSFLFTQRSNSMGFDEVFDCFDFRGDSVPLPLDSYTYVATLLQCPNTNAGCPGGTNLDAVGPLDDNFDTCSSISSGICFADLPTIDFQR